MNGKREQILESKREREREKERDKEREKERERERERGPNGCIFIRAYF